MFTRCYESDGGAPFQLPVTHHRFLIAILIVCSKYLNKLQLFGRLFDRSVCAP